MSEIDYSTYEAPSSPSLFIKLENGENRIRLVSKPENYQVHNQKIEGKFRSVKCEGTDCKLCAEGNKPRDRYAWVVLDRSDGQVKVYECGWMVFEQVLNLARDEDYGDPTQYDLKITKTGEGLDTNYTVIAVPKKTALTAEEKEKLEEANINLPVALGLVKGQEDASPAKPDIDPDKEFGDEVDEAFGG